MQGTTTQKTNADDGNIYLSVSANVLSMAESEELILLLNCTGNVRCSWHDDGDLKGEEAR